VPYHNCIYKPHPEDEPTCSKHVEDIKTKNSNINFENVRFIGLYCIIKLQCRLQNHKISHVLLFSYSSMHFLIIECFSSIELNFKRQYEARKLAYCLNLPKMHIEDTHMFEVLIMSLLKIRY